MPDSEVASAAAGAADEDQVDAIGLGFESTAAEAQRLEAQLAVAPGDLHARFRLIGHYFFNRYHNRCAEDVHVLVAHVLCLIEGWPEHPTMWLSFVLPEQDPEAFARVERAWLEAARRNPSVRVLYNAHCVLAGGSYAHAENLLRLGLEKCPDDREWHVAATRFYSYYGSRYGRPELLVRGAGAAERSIELCATALERASTIPIALRAFVEAQQCGRAEVLAREAIEMSGLGGPASRYHGHLVLGLLALETGDVEAAEGHLLSSARCVEGFYFESFGPPLHLAQALLDGGRAVAVRSFLSELSLRLKGRREELGSWLREVESGGRPRMELACEAGVGPRGGLLETDAPPSRP